MAFVRPGRPQLGHLRALGAAPRAPPRPGHRHGGLPGSSEMGRTVGEGGFKLKGLRKKASNRAYIQLRYVVIVF